MPAPIAVDLSSQRILVTGATAGIGRAAAEALARLGATVLVGARDAKKGERAREEISAATAIAASRCCSSTSPARPRSARRASGCARRAGRSTCC